MDRSIRSRAGIALAALGAVGLMALDAAAQEKPLTTTKDMTDTLKVTVSGRVELDYVYRSAEMTAWTASFSNVPRTGQPATSDGENTVEGYVAVRVHVEMSDKVSAVIEFGTKRVEGGDINEWGNVGAEGIQLREAHVTVKELLMPQLEAEVGISTWTFDVRGRGNSFAFDPRHSQTIFRNLAFISNNATQVDFDDDRFLLAGFPEELEPVGAWVRYMRDGITVDVVALPGVIEGGNPSNDEALYAVDLWYALDQVGKGSRVGLIFAIHNVGADANDYTSSNSGMFTVGGGLVLKEVGMPGLEIYGEAYFQFGDVGRNDPDGPGGAMQDEDIEAAGRAFQIGAQFTHMAGNPMPVWIGANFTWISGDEDNPPGPQNDDEVGRFLSYENISDLLILEDMYFGFDIDSNYTVFKLNAGVTLSVAGGQNNLDLELWLGFAEQTEETVFSGPPTFKEDQLGTEIDVKAKWRLSKQATLTGAVALLTGSDLLEKSMEEDGPAARDEADDSALLYTLGIDLKF